MAIQHKNISDAERHEPKGASSALSGQVLKSNGDTTTSFVNANTLVNVSYSTIVEAFSTASQSPSAVDTPLQVNFGAASSGTGYTLNAAGTLTVLNAGVYRTSFNLNFGRTGVTGVAILAARLLINDVPTSIVEAVRIDTSANSAPVQFDYIASFNANDTIKIEFIRDSAGNNDGGLITVPLVLSGWADSPSAWVKLQRILGAG